MQEEFEVAQKGNTDFDKKFVDWGELNELAYEDIILSINASYAVSKVTLQWCGMQKVWSILRKVEKYCGPACE